MCSVLRWVTIKEDEILIETCEAVLENLHELNPGTAFPSTEDEQYDVTGISHDKKESIFFIYILN